MGQRREHAELDRHRFSVLVFHRRWGKTVLAVNHLLKAALTCRRERPRFHYIAPTFRMARQAAWDYLKYFASVVPGHTKNETELAVKLPNGGQVQLLGADNPDSMRGIYSDGAFFDEYGLQPANVFTEVFRPALADRKGWAAFMGTPNGQNQFSEALDLARERTDAGDPNWYFSIQRASQTGIIPADELAAARAVMSDDEYEQEFECSFSASVRGAIYGKLMSAAEADGRVTRVPYDQVLPVDTYWDLGMDDEMAIWFGQSTRSGEHRLIDYIENSGEGLPAYVKMLRERPYVYGKHYAPPDINVRELGTGKSRKETAKSLGLTFDVMPDIGLEEGISAAKVLIPRCWFDAAKCKEGIKALKHYRREFDQKRNVFRALPVHDGASHGADAFRTFAVCSKTPTPEKSIRIPKIDQVHWSAI